MADSAPVKTRVRVAEGVYRKPNGKYIATYRDPGRKPHWKEFKTKKEAELWRAKGRLDPHALASGKRTLGEVWEKLLEHHSAEWHPNTRATWEQEWRKHIEPALGGWPVGKITVPAVKDFLADLEQHKVGAATRHKCRSLLHRILEEAVEDGEIASNPVSARGTRVKKAQPKKARILTAKELKRVLAAAPAVGGAQNALAIELMFMLGLRIGEMAGLQARDVDMTTGEISVTRTVSDTGGKLEVQEGTKTNKYRVIPVPKELPVWVRLVDHIRGAGLIGQAQVFQGQRGSVVRPNNWRKRIWAKTMEKAKILDPPTPHGARRTTASLLSAAGVPPATVQAILGHSTLQQTGEYIDVPQAEMQKGLRKLGNLYG